MELAAHRSMLSSRSWFGDVVWLAFVSTQAADGVLTYLGILTFGLAAEGNPIIAWYAAIFGAKAALLGAKLISVMCAALLHVRAMHRALGLLTLLAFMAAVRPWLSLLWP
jgi:hypothetical protein